MKVLFFFLLGMTIFMSYLNNKIFYWYFYVDIIRNMIIFSSVLPVSMKVNIEFAKLYYTHTINNDNKI